MKVKDIDALREQISKDPREAFTKHQVWLLASEHNKTTPTFDAIPKSVLEDIKAEIENQLFVGRILNSKDFDDGLKWCLDIIDRHISGKENHD